MLPEAQLLTVGGDTISRYNPRRPRLSPRPVDVAATPIERAAGRSCTIRTPMIRCQRCSTENLDGSQYCDECGALLAGGIALASRVPETREDFAGERGIGLRTNVVKAVDSSDERRSAPSGPVSLPPAKPDGAAAVAAAAKLVIQRGRSMGKEFALDNDEIYIGRWDADGGIFPDIDLDSDDPEAKVSRRHARITRREGQHYIEDLGSTNGTFVNRGRRLIPGDRQQIHDGDEIIIGKTFMRFSTAK